MQAIAGWNRKNRVLAEHNPFDRCGDCGRHNRAGEHGLVEIADHLLDCKSHCGNRCIEGRRNARRGANRQQLALALARQSSHTPQQAGDAGADLHRRALAAQ